jgi:hypothetical protein
MESTKTGYHTADSASWLDLVIESLKVAVIAFVVMQVKELIDAGTLDILGVLVDSLLIGAALFVVNAVLKLARPGR